MNGLKKIDLEPHWKNECQYITFTCNQCKQEIERSMVTDHNCIETLLYTFKTLKFENKMLHKKLGEKDVL